MKQQWTFRSVVEVGDLVKTGDNTGVVLNVEYVKAGQSWVTCLWDDGEIDAVGDGDITILSDEKSK